MVWAALRMPPGWIYYSFSRSTGECVNNALASTLSRALRICRRNKADPQQPFLSTAFVPPLCAVVPFPIQQYAISSSFQFNLNLCHLSPTPSSSVSTPPVCVPSLALSLSLSPNLSSATEHPSQKNSITIKMFVWAGLARAVWVDGWRMGGVGALQACHPPWVQRFPRGTLLSNGKPFTQPSARKA